MTPQEIKIKLQEESIDKGVWNCCLNCEFWKNEPLLDKVHGEIYGPYYCGYYDVIPPLKVIVIGCINWNLKIPF